MTEVRLMNVNNILKNYGFREGVYNSGDSANCKFNLLTQSTYGKIEEGASIDTAEEFLTAAYYSPIKIEYKAQAVIDKELPKGKEGALKLTTMWLKKCAEEDACDGAQKAIDIIKTKSGLNDTDIRNYFVAAIEKEALAQGKKYLGKYYSNDELKYVVKPLIEYYMNPTKANLEKLADAQASSKDVVAYINFIREIGGNTLAVRVNRA